jgi:hypothetical protein
MAAHARGGDPQTSHDAARSVWNSTPLQRRILTELRRAILDRGMTGLTDEAVAFYVTEVEGKPVSPSGLRSRRAELVDAGLITDSHRTGITKSGRKTVIWTLSPDGWAHLADVPS